MKTKRISIIAIFFMCMFLPITANADASCEELYVYSAEVPDEITEYVKGNIANIVRYSGVCDNIQKVIVGSPFKLPANDFDAKDLYYYPIQDERGTILYTLRLYYNHQNSIEYVFSEDMVSGLNSIRGYTSQDMPASICTNGNDVVATVNDIEILLFASKKENDISMSMCSTNLEKREIVNLTEVIYEEEMLSNRVKERSASNLLSTSIRETQGAKPWCAAYVTAFITSYKTNSSIYANQVMAHAYPNLSTTELASKSLSPTQAASFGLSKGLSPIIVEATLSESDIKYEIDSNSPFYIGGIDGNNRHALAVRGYTPYGYSIWNPHNNYYSLISMGTTSYVEADGTTWQWYRTIWRWR